MDSSVMPRATFTAMADSSQQDWDHIMAAYVPYLDDLPRRIVASLMQLEGDYGGFAIDRLTHCLQTATRALRDGRDEEYVVCALVHDIGDTLAPLNHGEIAAAVLKPYVSEENHWIIQHHTTFQGLYYFEYTGGDKNAREKYRDSPYFDACEHFCKEYDQCAFDPNYESESLEFFLPMLQRVLKRPGQMQQEAQK